MAFKMKYKNLEEVVKGLKSAVVMHGKQAKTIEKHIGDMKKDSPMKKEGTVAKGKQQVYKKEIKQLETKLDKMFPNYDQNETEITKTYKRINDLRDKMAGHRVGERPTPGDKNTGK